MPSFLVVDRHIVTYMVAYAVMLVFLFVLQNEYEKLVSRVEKAEEGSLVQSDSEYTEFLGVERSNHPTIIKVGTKLCQFYE